VIGVGLACMLAGPVGPAAASPAGIRAAIHTAEPQLLADEAGTVAAIGKFAANRDATPVVAAAEKAVVSLKALRRKVMAQQPGKMKAAKSDIVRGLNGAIAGYQTLKKAFATAASDKAAAIAGIERAELQLQRGKGQLETGIGLLG
jgi:hypothetical protein